MNFKTIFLLTDFSDHSRNACRFAIESFGSEVDYFLINSFDIRTTAATLIDIEEIAREESELHLKNVKKELREEFPDLGLKITCLSKSGKTVNVINRLRKEYPADIVVVGSKGFSKLDGILIGSVTNSVMRGVDAPVLSVPIKAKFNKMDQIVLGSDLLNSNKKSVLNVLAKLKETFKSKISVASVKNHDGDLTDEENAILDKMGKNEIFEEYNILREEDISKGLMEYCEKTNADLLVVVAKHTSFFKRFFHKSITAELINLTALPILVLDDN